MTRARVFTHLDEVQADGMACVMCGTRYGEKNAPASEPVGQSLSGNQVFACSGICADLAKVDDPTL